MRLAQATTADASMSEAFEYDLNSNILHLERRYGGDAVQDAAMTYYGNRIASVNDASLPYYTDIVPSFAAGTYTQQYDEDGRLTADGTRQITRITYTDNGVQMPQSIDFANGSRIINTYLPDGTLLRRDLRTIRTRTVVRVNAQGDTIVRTIREPVIDVTRYRGDWEINGSRWRLNTTEGIALIGSAATANATEVANATAVASGSAANNAGAGASAGTTFSHLWYVRDRLGSVRSVVDATGTILQNTAYYASGVPVQCFDTRRVTDRGHIGNRYLDFAAIGWYDNTARMHDALLCRFTTRDPLATDYPSLSPYTHCAANPLRYIDPTGRWYAEVHSSPERGTNPYAVMSVFSKDNIMVFRTIVKVKGNGRERNVTNNDTPQGEYKIIGWRKTGTAPYNYNTSSFGPNPLLALDYKGGEGESRNGMHVHGGREQGPELRGTHGCIRIMDKDIALLKQITDELTKEDETDQPTTLIVVDDLVCPVTLKDRDDVLLISYYLLQEVLVNDKTTTDETDAQE